MPSTSVPDSPIAAPVEHVILVDLHDREVGVAEKLEAHSHGWLHRALSVFVFDRAGQLLLQRRAADKYHSSGLWANSCCGHPRPGEPVIDAAQRRLREEMGIACQLQSAFSFTYRADVGRGLTENEVDHVFVGRFDGQVSPEPREVDAWRWISLAHLVAEVEAEPDQFAAWFPIALEKLLLRAPPHGRLG